MEFTEHQITRAPSHLAIRRRRSRCAGDLSLLQPSRLFPESSAPRSPHLPDSSPTAPELTSTPRGAPSTATASQQPRCRQPHHYWYHYCLAATTHADDLPSPSPPASHTATGAAAPTPNQPRTPAHTAMKTKTARPAERDLHGHFPEHRQRHQQCVRTVCKIVAVLVGVKTS